MTSYVHHTLYGFYDIVMYQKDAEVDSWPLMSSPIPVLTILALYLAFVLKFGPRYMENRKPLTLQRFLVVYNLCQVLFSLWISSMALRVKMSQIFQDGHPQGNSNAIYTKSLHEGAWYYFISKVVDLLDTILFILRKKQSQVTFLHVYHHVSTCLFSWGYLKYLPGEQGIIIGLLNSFVHVFMYSYYMIAALGPNYTKYLWWKKYMTWIQLLQFGLMLSYLTLLLVFDCQLPKGLTFFFVANVTIFLILFTRFYRATYKCKRHS